MAWSTELDGLMPHTITVAGLASFSTDGYATEVYGSASTYTARVAGKQTLVKSFRGIDELAKTVAWVKTTSTFAPSDQFTLPDGSTPELLAVEAYPDEDGHHHVKLMFGD